MNQKEAARTKGAVPVRADADEGLCLAFRGLSFAWEGAPLADAGLASVAGRYLRTIPQVKLNQKFNLVNRFMSPFTISRLSRLVNIDGVLLPV